MIWGTCFIIRGTFDIIRGTFINIQGTFERQIDITDQKITKDQRVMIIVNGHQEAIRCGVIHKWN